MITVVIGQVSDEALRWLFALTATTSYDDVVHTFLAGLVAAFAVGAWRLRRGRSSLSRPGWLADSRR